MCSFHLVPRSLFFVCWLSVHNWPLTKHNLEFMELYDVRIVRSELCCALGVGPFLDSTCLHLLTTRHAPPLFVRGHVIHVHLRQRDYGYLACRPEERCISVHPGSSCSWALLHSRRQWSQCHSHTNYLSLWCMGSRWEWQMLVKLRQVTMS